MRKPEKTGKNNKTGANLKTNHTRKPEKHQRKIPIKWDNLKKTWKKQQWNKKASEHFEQSNCQMRTPKNILESISKTEKLEKIQEK